MIELKHVSKTYMGKLAATQDFSMKTAALDDISLQLPQGEIVGLFGENGA